jgi:hypothetical protein
LAEPKCEVALVEGNARIIEFSRKGYLRPTVAIALESGGKVRVVVPDELQNTSYTSFRCSGAGRNIFMELVGRWLHVRPDRVGDVGSYEPWHRMFRIELFCPRGCRRRLGWRGENCIGGPSARGKATSVHATSVHASQGRPACARRAEVARLGTGRVMGRYVVRGVVHEKWLWIAYTHARARMDCGDNTLVNALRMWLSAVRAISPPSSRQRKEIREMARFLLRCA